MFHEGYNSTGEVLAALSTHLPGHVYDSVLKTGETIIGGERHADYIVRTVFCIGKLIKSIAPGLSISGPCEEPCGRWFTWNPSSQSWT